MQKLLTLSWASILLVFSSLFSWAQEDQQFTIDTIPPRLSEQWEPIPPKVDPGDAQTAPSDAIILFDGKDLSQWKNAKGSTPEWELKDGVVTVVPGTGSISSKASFGDIQLHIEWRSPSEIVGDGQNRGNSGIFLMGRYEIQVLDNYTNKTYANGQASSVYKQHIPLVNACKAPGEWQSYDIIFNAPIFSDAGKLLRPATVTVLHNGVLVQNHVTLLGPTQYKKIPRYEAHAAKLPISLQDHSCKVSYRNIWVREL